MNEQARQDFLAIKLKLASPEEIKSWSHGEVTRPETINYRTQKPEKDGLFCEKIFGPSKDWECYCGKYKKIRYKGIICDKCGVEVTRSFVRRERMGHIELSSPVAHIWFLRGVPSKIGLALDLSVQTLEKVVYFAAFIITKVDESLKVETLKQIDTEAEAKRKVVREEYERDLAILKQQNKKPTELETEIVNLSVMRDEKLKDLEEAVAIARRELRELRVSEIISEAKFHELSLKYGHIFEASIGAEAIYKLLREIDISKKIKDLEEEIATSGSSERHHFMRRLRFFKHLKKNHLRPEWMVLTVVPVIPPDLRPMVQLDGGRFATSDLNDLYRRVINRNNRLKRLKELGAPEVIQRNEKRMLQEAVDALIDNSARQGKTVAASTGQRRMLKSIADMLKGKQGRFRQNLLGKRVDYSGRSVIVVGPHLKLDQCGLPKKMALELFKPFVISRLIQREYVYNVRSASRFIEEDRPEVWDILEEITKESYVLLNRAPTLHRLGIQAFRPVLIEGKAIQIHPLVCPAFNADFDGDQMAVHVPLTEEAKKEAKEMMLSAKNLLKPATGEPVITPSQDIVLGVYYMTTLKDSDQKRKLFYSNSEEAVLAWSLGYIGLQTKIKVKVDKEILDTSIARVFFNNVLPPKQRFINEQIDKKRLKEIIAITLVQEGRERTVELLDDIKDLSIKFITASGLSWGVDDTPIPEEKKRIVTQAEKEVEEIYNQYSMGLLTETERRTKVIEVWSRVKNELTKACQKALDKFGPTFLMIDSGARGSWGQVTQMTGMKGLVINPAGETIELPVKASFKDGFNVLEYFISSHGARKGLTDTALRTANAGYLTRRLIDVAQDVVIKEEDCGTKEGITLTKKESKEIGEVLAKRLLGRVLAEDLRNKKGKVIFKEGTLITEKEKAKIEKMDLDQAKIRSPLTCETERGLCRQCYGYDLGYNQLVEIGTAVGIIAAQSIGEPGTQLTMRTFHTGGVAGQDITQGLPRVEELFEARPLKKAAVLSDVDGEVEEIIEQGKQCIVRVRHVKKLQNEYKLLKSDDLEVKDNDTVLRGDVLFKRGSQVWSSPADGQVRIKKNILQLSGEEEKIKEFIIPVGFTVWVNEGELVSKGTQLCEGSLDLRQLYALRGQEAVQKYIIKEIQYIYSSQGQKLNDKHIEVIIRQMFSRYIVKDPGDTDFVAGEMITKDQLFEANKAIKQTKAREVQAENVLLGITKASLSADSFLSAASFQETARVLIDAAITGKTDYLRGLKENVIIGKLIPVGTGFVKK